MALTASGESFGTFLVSESLISSKLTLWRRTATVRRRFPRDVLPGENGHNRDCAPLLLSWLLPASCEHVPQLPYAVFCPPKGVNRCHDLVARAVIRFVHLKANIRGRSHILAPAMNSRSAAEAPNIFAQCFRRDGSLAIHQVSQTPTLSGFTMMAHVYVRSADMLHFEVETYIDVVRDLNEWDALVHPVALAVEGHFSLNLS